ncbi:MAG: class III cytochrome C family protein [Rhodocyclaceae bacterium]|nr:class III cytochrome C family protein [Rhodocyclaceae bacterium]
MSRVVKIILALNLAALALLSFVYPQFMVGPGKLIPGHHALEADCFACHAPLTGASSARCITCHEPKDIGRLTTTGKPVLKPLTKTPFHQKLARQDCVACHSDHAGVKRFRQSGRFDHTLLPTGARSQCRDCHAPPRDRVHTDAIGQCSTCHSATAWRPATLKHDDYFVLDRDHNASCTTCHTRNDYTAYTCYGCHEHTPQNIRREHIEEGIRDFSNCVECHRSADEHDIRGRGGRGGRGGEGRGRGGDDD